MFTLVSVALLVASVFGSEWVVDSWLGEDRRIWLAWAGLALGLLASALVKASGITELTRLLRNALIGAGIGTALRRLGLKLPWLRRGLRLLGIETEPEERPPMEALRWSGLSAWLLQLGWAGGLIGVGLIWTGGIAG